MYEAKSRFAMPAHEALAELNPWSQLHRIWPIEEHTRVEPWDPNAVEEWRVTLCVEGVAHVGAGRGRSVADAKAAAAADLVLHLRQADGEIVPPKRRGVNRGQAVAEFSAENILGQWDQQMLILLMLRLDQKRTGVHSANFSDRRKQLQRRKKPCAVRLSGRRPLSEPSRLNT
jgi:hypothetical protein